MSDVPGELLSVSTVRFVHVGGGVWVNPAHVVAIGPAATAAEHTVIELVTGSTHHTELWPQNLIAVLTGTD